MIFFFGKFSTGSAREFAEKEGRQQELKLAKGGPPTNGGLCVNINDR